MLFNVITPPNWTAAVLMGYETSDLALLVEDYKRKQLALAIQLLLTKEANNE